MKWLSSLFGAKKNASTEPHPAASGKVDVDKMYEGPSSSRNLTAERAYAVGIVRRLIELKDSLIQAASRSDSASATLFIGLVNSIQGVIVLHLRVFFELESLSFNPCVYDKYLDGWIQPRTLAPQTVPAGRTPTLVFRLTNLSAESTSGTVRASIRDDALGIAGTSTSLIGGPATHNEISALASGSSAEGSLWFYGMPPGTYRLRLQYAISNGSTGGYVVTPRGIEHYGGTEIAIEKEQWYLSGDLNSIRSAIRNLLGIKVVIGSSGCFTAEGTAPDFSHRSIKVNCGGRPGVAVSVFQYGDRRYDGDAGLDVTIRGQVITYDQDSNDPNQRLPSIDLSIDSTEWFHDRPDRSHINIRRKTKQFFVHLVPRNPRGSGDWLINGHYGTDPATTTTGGRKIKGRLDSSGKYTPDPGVDDFAFDMMSLFSNEVDRISFFASVLNEPAHNTPTPPGFSVVRALIDEPSPVLAKKALITGALTALRFVICSPQIMVPAILTGQEYLPLVCGATTVILSMAGVVAVTLAPSAFGPLPPPEGQPLFPPVPPLPPTWHPSPPPWPENEPCIFACLPGEVCVFGSCEPLNTPGPVDTP